MIKSRLQKAILTIALLSTSLMAESSNYSYNTNSLVGIEGGLSSLNYEFGTPTNNAVDKIFISHAGLKLGAESDDFRVFLSGRYFYDSSKKHDYIVTYGGEIQYKFNVTKIFNAYIGANGGIANISYRATGESFTRTISSPYFGGDLGVNVHLGKSVDWEIGGRVMAIQADNTKDGKTYHINQIITAYTSIIFKWKMD
jgi:hypothetical protein